MAGRKRKVGVPRRPDGKIDGNYHAAKLKETARDIVLAQRRRHHGALLPGDKRIGHGRSHINDRRYGYALGRLMIAGAISQKEHAAGENFGELFTAYKRIVDMPPAVVKALDYGATTSPFMSVRGELNDAQIASLKRRYASAARAIARGGRGCFDAVYDVIVRDMDPDDPEKVRAGLAALVKHFSPTRRGKSRGCASSTNKVVVKG